MLCEYERGECSIEIATVIIVTDPLALAETLLVPRSVTVVLSQSSLWRYEKQQGVQQRSWAIPISNLNSWKSWRPLSRAAMCLLCFQLAMGRVSASVVCLLCLINC